MSVKNRSHKIFPKYCLFNSSTIENTVQDEKIDPIIFRVLFWQDKAIFKTVYKSLIPHCIWSGQPIQTDLFCNVFKVCQKH